MINTLNLFAMLVQTATLTVTSDAFKNGENIPVKYTCEGENMQPVITVSHIPAEAKSLALICHDPDAPNGGFTHWVVYNIPSSSDGTVNIKEHTGTAGVNGKGEKKYT